MNFILRPWKTSDLESLCESANNINIANFMTNQFIHPFTKAHGLKFIEMAIKDVPTHIFAIEVDGNAVGGIGIHPQQDILCKNAELGYWLAEKYWNKGIISGAIPKILDYAFTTFPIDRIYARPFGNNKASQHILEKTGFILEATLSKTIYKNGEFQDELIYSMRKK